MKKLTENDLLFSPKTITDLTGSGGNNPNVVTTVDNCPDTFTCETECEGCNTEEDNCGSDGCESNACGTYLNTCADTCFCADTLSRQEVCCEQTVDGATCVVPNDSEDVCPVTVDPNCGHTPLCAETEGCMYPNN